MLIDTHTHILPGMDDGPATLAKSIRMARIAVDDGIRIMIATPHCYSGVYSNSRESIIFACEQFNQSLKENNIDLLVLPGCEAYLNPEILDDLEKERLLTLNDTGRYLSVELPDQFKPDAIMNFISHMCNNGVVPIITHPERNPVIQRDVDILRDLILSGALCQITGSSLMSQFGKQSMKSCKKILKQDMVHLIASDAHSVKARPPLLSEAVRRLSSIMDGKKVKRICHDNPQKVIRGELIREPA